MDAVAGLSPRLTTLRWIFISTLLQMLACASPRGTLSSFGGAEPASAAKVRAFDSPLLLQGRVAGSELVVGTRVTVYQQAVDGRLMPVSDETMVTDPRGHYQLTVWPDMHGTLELVVQAHGDAGPRWALVSLEEISYPHPQMFAPVLNAQTTVETQAYQAACEAGLWPPNLPGQRGQGWMGAALASEVLSSPAYGTTVRILGQAIAGAAQAWHQTLLRLGRQALARVPATDAGGGKLDSDQLDQLALACQAAVETFEFYARWLEARLQVKIWQEMELLRARWISRGIEAFFKRHGSLAQQVRLHRLTEALKVQLESLPENLGSIPMHRQAAWKDYHQGVVELLAPDSLMCNPSHIEKSLAPQLDAVFQKLTSLQEAPTPDAKAVAVSYALVKAWQDAPAQVGSCGMGMPPGADAKAWASERVRMLVQLRLAAHP